LPVERLWGVGPVTSEKLHAVRLHTVGQVAALELRELVQLVGPAAGRHLHALAHNRDPRRVEVGRRRRSIGSQHAIGRGPHTPADLDLVLVGVVDRVTRRMRTADRRGSTVTVRLRFDDFTRSTASHTLSRPTSSTGLVLDVARRLLRARMPDIEAKGCTLVGLAVSGLDDNPAQLVLPFTASSGVELDEAVDAVRERFGTTALRRAVQVGRRERPAMPILPD
jgi:DNA polymerase-4